MDPGEEEQLGLVDVADAGQDALIEEGGRDGPTFPETGSSDELIDVKPGDDVRAESVQGAVDKPGSIDVD
jgi:hypothetical protein